MDMEAGLRHYIRENVNGDNCTPPVQSTYALHRNLCPTACTCTHQM